MNSSMNQTKDQLINRYELRTDRLIIQPATAPDVRAAAEKDATLMSELLNAAIPADWPPDLLQDALAPTADALDAGKSCPPWAMYWVFLAEPRTLIGNVGFKAAPADNGHVEVGYSIVNSHQRKGYATEATQALIDFAFADSAVTHVAAETLPDLIPSRRVMEKLGMTCIAEGVTGFSGDENVVRYEIRRS